MVLMRRHRVREEALFLKAKIVSTSLRLVQTLKSRHSYQVARIQAAMMSGRQPIAPEYNDNSDYSVTLSDRRGSWDDETDGKFTRFNKLKQYLISKRQELALDTLHFPLSEHAFHAHISQEGLISLTSFKFGSLFKLCQQRKELFSWKTISFSGVDQN